MEGYLKKWTNLYNGWKNRYFCFKNKYLVYSKEKVKNIFRVVK